MRISTGMQYKSHLNYLQTANSKVDEASTRYNTGKLFQTAGENPSGMASTIKYTADISAYNQYKVNAGIVSDSLSHEETALGQIWDSLSGIKTRLIQAVNGTLDDGGRSALAEDIKQTQAQIFDLMNTKNAEGQYIFSGAQSDQPTYVLTTDGKYQCQADGSNKYVLVSPTIKLQTTDSGLNIFENQNLANDFTASGYDTSKITHAGVKDYDQFNTFFKNHYSYTDANANEFKIEFTSPTEWKMVDKDGNAVNDVSGNPITGEVKDGKIEVQGMSFTLSTDADKQPAAGDSITITLDKPEQDNILNQLTDMINMLNVPQDEWANQNPPMSSDSITQAISKMQQNVELAMTQVDSYRGMVGARAANIDAIIKSNETMSDIKSEAKANVSEVDAFTAVSDLLMTQNALEVARQSYQVVHSSTLFDYMR